MIPDQDEDLIQFWDSHKSSKPSLILIYLYTQMLTPKLVRLHYIVDTERKKKHW